ncbi:MAG TPA: peptidylprolyl isomerase [Candidatus Aminicenantes bacterium]|nr:peptidylprolyl isomerase [Candidatus Aminicenantes bacterium]
MPKTISLMVLSALVAAGACAPKAEKAVLEEGSPAYALAQELAAKVPALAPDKTTVIAEAEGLSVTAAEVLLAMRRNRGSFTDKLKEADAARLREIFERGATQIVERKLLLAAAKAAKTVVAPSELDQAMQSEYARAGGEEAFLKALKDAGVSADYVRASVGETLLINKLLKGVAEKAPRVGEEELREAYAAESQGDKTASVRHILLLTQGKTEAEKAEARTKIEGLLARARAGEDFAELARLYSEDPGSKANGGLYEDFGRGQMVKPFEDAAFSVPVGEISGIVETAYGYHILKIVGRKKETRTFEEVRAELEARLAQAKQGTAVEDYVKALKDKAKFRLIGL